MRVDAIAASVRDAGRRIRARVVGAAPWQILAGGWLVLAIYAYPGQVTWDSLEALAEVRAGVYTDGAPPVFKALWSLTEQLAAGPVGMFAVQGVAFGIGVFAILRRVLAPRAAAWLTSAVLMFPPVMLPLAVIWEHSMMAALLVLGTAALTSPRRRVALAGLVVVFVASGVRYNACVATLPLIVLLFRWSPDMRPLRRYAIAVGAWLAITLAAFGANVALTDVEMHRRLSTVAVHDIAGIVRFTRPAPDDATLRPILAGTGIRFEHDIAVTLGKRYSPRAALTLLHPERGAWTLPLYGRAPAPAAQRDAIGAAWRELVTQHPGAYLRHRLAVMLQLLRQRDQVVVSRTPPHHEVALAAGVPTTPSATQVAMSKAMRMLAAHTPLFATWLYLALALGLLVLARRQRDVVALLVSGIAWELSWFFVAPAAEHRHSDWLVVSACLALVLVIARRRRA